MSLSDRKYSDVYLAVKDIINEIRALPNRDDQILAKICLLDGGGVNKFEVIDIIEKRFGLFDDEKT